ncbi:MAG: L-histidine N(alpha)-methyltransferase [Acidobacteria bacterium]|nr:L-histidine N(alpha)-methyltransferase [Acidobacteriota bacterium]MBV9477992.1 L-histidine N(alpha)-methyltransferase [Acidobacteriota bacterium]
MCAAAVPVSPTSRFTLRHGAVAAGDFADDVRRGLTASRKSLPPRWFYDELGSSLFDAICFLPEYYVMRAEAEVLHAHASEICDAFGAQVRLVELGSGAARKTRILLDVLTERQRELEYVPVDVDASMLERSARELLADYPHLRITAVRADFASPSSSLAMLGPHRGRNVVLFLGSTIGNLDPDAAIAMLRDLRSALSRGDALLLGADLRKPRNVLEPAYDDPLGVTAAFNKNLLVRMNRELNADFALDRFTHRAFYNEPLGRIEMHLVSTQPQRVHLAALDLSVDFAEAETIHTESSYKHDESTLAALAQSSGFTIAHLWTDARAWFADALFVAS